MPTVAEVVGRTLREAGIPRVFGYPGGETLDFMEGFRRAGLEFVLTRHEAAAAFMAAAVGELTGVPGVCLATLGPGATNLVTGVAHAYLDRAPVVALSAQLPPASYPVHPHQRLDLQALFAPVTKGTARLHPENAGRVAASALALAGAERPGPVYLEFPSDLGAGDAPEEPVWAGQPGYPGAGERRALLWADGGGAAPAAARGVIRRAAAALAGARRPVLLVGPGAVRGRATPALVSLAEAGRFAVVDLPKAKGAFPPDHPQFLGTLEMSGKDLLFRVLEEADWAVCAGVDPVEFDRPWGFGCAVVHLDVIPEPDGFYPVAWELLGPVAAGAAALAAAVTDARAAGEPGAHDRGWPDGAWAAVRDELAAYVRERPAGAGSAPTGSGAAPPLWAVVEALRAAAPPDTVLATDVGAHKMIAGQVWRTREPGSYLVSNGLSAMGFGIPAAIAARLVHPDRPACALVGDGGFMMSAGELETAVRLGVSVAVVVAVDGALGSIRRGQRARGYPSLGVEFGPADYAAVAAGLGARAVVAETPEAARAALGDALGAGGPTVIVCPVDGDAYRP